MAEATRKRSGHRSQYQTGWLGHLAQHDHATPGECCTWVARQERVDHAVALDPALPFEGVRHDIDPEMGLPARPVPGMAFVAVGFILHFQAVRRESFGEFL